MSMVFSKHKDGHYDEEGRWVQLKHCFTYCGDDHCTCRPPSGRWKVPVKRESELQIKRAEWSLKCSKAYGTMVWFLVGFRVLSAEEDKSEHVKRESQDTDDGER